MSLKEEATSCPHAVGAKLVEIASKESESKLLVFATKHNAFLNICYS